MNERTNAVVRVETALAGGLMILTGASALPLALASADGARPAVTATSLASMALGVVLIASGVESIRRRHFLFAFAIPVLLALADLGYVVATRQWIATSSVVLWLLVVGALWSQRAAFRDRPHPPSAAATRTSAPAGSRCRTRRLGRPA